MGDIAETSTDRRIRVDEIDRNARTGIVEQSGGRIDHQRSADDNHDIGLEVYPSGESPKYLTVTGRHAVEGELKTEAGDRFIPIVPELLAMLQEAREYDVGEDDEYIFHTEDGISILLWGTPGFNILPPVRISLDYTGSF